MDKIEKGLGLTPHRSLGEVTPPPLGVGLGRRLRAASRSRGSRYDA